MKASPSPSPPASPAGGGTLLLTAFDALFELVALALAVVALLGGGAKDIKLIQGVLYGLVSKMAMVDFVKA